nr:hypothetical protein [Chromobacterium paludis]
MAFGATVDLDRVQAMQRPVEGQAQRLRLGWRRAKIGWQQGGQLPPRVRRQNARRLFDVARVQQPAQRVGLQLRGRSQQPQMRWMAAAQAGLPAQPASRLHFLQDFAGVARRAAQRAGDIGQADGAVVIGKGAVQALIMLERAHKRGAVG